MIKPIFFFTIKINFNEMCQLLDSVNWIETFSNKTIYGAV